MSTKKHREVIQAHVGGHTLLSSMPVSLCNQIQLDMLPNLSLFLLSTRHHLTCTVALFSQPPSEICHICWLYIRNQILQTPLSWLNGYADWDSRPVRIKEMRARGMVWKQVLQWKNWKQYVLCFTLLFMLLFELDKESYCTSFTDLQAKQRVDKTRFHHVNCWCSRNNPVKCHTKLRCMS